MVNSAWEFTHARAALPQRRKGHVSVLPERIRADYFARLTRSPYPVVVRRISSGSWTRRGSTAAEPGTLRWM